MVDEAFVFLLVSAETAPLAVSVVGFEAPQAIHVPAEQHGRGYHNLQANRTLQFRVIDYRIYLRRLHSLDKLCIKICLTEALFIQAF